MDKEDNRISQGKKEVKYNLEMEETNVLVYKNRNGELVEGKDQEGVVIETN